ncbi:DUF418 domain-containing protein [Metabacillus fastidiosus]|uniref:DUF418 domain-containing protein n=1 Tax=Metabacillus fastidiosus TaxID=1458 RepID=A0ABU6P155_9BACI|nr:DUF418 domain-containing protein [Metabacillus fastidiosus]
MEIKKQRIHAIDGIRGLSLLGILLANLLIFQYGGVGKDEIQLFSLSDIDYGFYYFTKIAIEGSFVPIFAFLFGYSAIKMKESLQNKGLKAKKFFIRRYIMLIILGILHLSFLWEGDILLLYGIIGFFLLFFLNRKTKTILIWASILLFFTAIVLSFLLIPDASNVAEEEKIISFVKTATDIYTNGTYEEMMNQRGKNPMDIPIYISILLMFLSPLFVGPLFLFGMYAAKIKMFTKPLLEKKKYLLGTLLIPVGLLMKASFYIGSVNAVTGILAPIGAYVLAFGYISAFALMYTRAKESIILKGFESVGRLSLTNYLLQSVVFTTIFYSYGLGYFGKLGATIGFILGVSFYILQMAGSYLYLKTAKIGPVEMLLRMWTNFSFDGKIKEQTVNNRDVSI